MNLQLGTGKRTGGFSGDDARWQAVLHRDRAADGAFVYAVRSTGVYCRPSCAARLPRRENVSFHANCGAAEAAGFRSCKRCRPKEVALAERQAAAIAKVCRRIEQTEEMPTLDTLAKAAGMSRFHFHRLFKSLTGVTPKAYGEAYRRRRMRNALVWSKTVTEAIYDAGFNSNGRFYAASTDGLGMTPSEFRGRGQGTSIRFAVGECWLSSILVAATDKGVCAILLGDDPETLLCDLQSRFAKAQLIGGDKGFEKLVAEVVGFIENPALGLDLPLDVRGTAFQQRVWQALRGIPAGSTASYAEIAKRIRKPKSVRAVAQACASNPVAIAIPCHRVVRTDGSLSGYRWGIERKRALLKHEALGKAEKRSGAKPAPQ
ncbi:MAG: bifunctional DNA-binding transcriptional regulator/O6-methylguanine-DNA methyltransferase Ada [Alphaproteobacteria bacterium]